MWVLMVCWKEVAAQLLAAPGKHAARVDQALVGEPLESHPADKAERCWRIGQLGVQERRESGEER